MMSRKHKRKQGKLSNKTVYANNGFKKTNNKKPYKTVKLGAIHTLEFYLKNLFPEKNTITVELTPEEFHDLCKKRLARKKNTAFKQLNLKKNKQSALYSSKSKPLSSDHSTLESSSSKYPKNNLNNKNKKMKTHKNKTKTKKSNLKKNILNTLHKTSYIPDNYNAELNENYAYDLENNPDDIFEGKSDLIFEDEMSQTESEKDNY